jgi:hypothetical protein
MLRNIKRLAPLGLTAALTLVPVTAMTACSSLSTLTPPAAATSTLQPATSTPPRTPAFNTDPEQGGGASGTIAAISGDTFTLSTRQGRVTVNVPVNTSIQKEIAGSIADLQAGQFLMIDGTTDSNGNMTATSITVRPREPISRIGPPGGSFNGTGGRPDISDNGGRPDFGFFGNGTSGGPEGGAFGELLKINGDTLTITTASGQEITVTVGGGAAIQTIASATLADLQVGDSLTVIGSHDAAGNIDAFFVTIGAERLPRFTTGR